MKKMFNKMWIAVVIAIVMMVCTVFPTGSILAQDDNGSSCSDFIGLSDFKATPISDEEARRLLAEEKSASYSQNKYSNREWSLYGSEYISSKLSYDEWVFFQSLYNNSVAVMNSADYYAFLPSVNCSAIGLDRAIDLVYMFEYQNPQFYFLNNSLKYYGSEIWVDIYWSFMEGSSRATNTDLIFSYVDNWLSEINTYSSEYDKEKCIYNIICDNVSYVCGCYDQTVYSAIVLGETVCAGYSKMFTLLANAAGLEAIGITSEEHAWNEVRIDGNWYNVDATWDDDSYWYCFNVSDYTIGDYNHTPESEYNGLRPLCPNDLEGFSSKGIYVLSSDKSGITAGAITDNYSGDTLQYSWYAAGDDGNWINISGWSTSEWLNSWVPSKVGNYVLLCKIREYNDSSTEQSVSTAVAYHSYIKGICQMPYTGAGGGYLIGIEGYGSYTCEMLILDCSLLAQGKDAWIYTTGKCGMTNNCLWTVWQPQYGYYWTLYRIYDAHGNIVDEACYGFVNAY